MTRRHSGFFKNHFDNIDEAGITTSRDRISV
jgi:hypothetical protein